ncbi:MAG: polysaccharide biosynthesis C-terminal domain-containing protein [Bacteroidales bacterium]|jgi:O-antigen/teichoic acid export membrane protein|nr:polysaccharide biosynthesis C-terminal domain-containing protein [Bacteroidales bacterium]
MGVIARQSVKGSIYNYLGAAVAFLNTLFLMPILFSTNQVGLINVLLAISSMVAQFSTLGVNYVNIRLFPYFKTKDKYHKGFARLILIFSIAGIAISTSWFFLFKGNIISSNIEKAPLLSENVYYLIPMIIASLTYLILDGYFRSIYKASTSIFFRELFMRLLIFFGLMLYKFNLIDFQNFLNYYMLAFVSPSIIMFAYLIRIGEFKVRAKFRDLPPNIWRLVASVAFFGMISGFTNISIMNMDKFLISKYLDLSSAGIYAVSFYFGTMILIPGKAVRRISSAVISEGFQNNDLNKVKMVYVKSNLNMFIGGLILFVFLWANIHNILRILPPEYAAGKWAIFIIASAFVLNMISGLSNQVILYSSAYRLHSFIMLGLLAILIVSNIILIPKMGLEGAALATFITYLIDMLFKWIFIWRKFNIQPFQWKHFFIFLIAVSIYALSLLLPELSLIPDMIIRSAGIGILFIIGIRVFKLSDDLNAIIDRALEILHLKSR